VAGAEGDIGVGAVVDVVTDMGAADTLGLLEVRAKPAAVPPAPTSAAAATAITTPNRRPLRMLRIFEFIIFPLGSHHTMDDVHEVTTN